MADQWGMNDKIVKTDNFGANDEIDQHNPLRRGWNKMTQSVGITKDLALGDNVGAAQKLADADTYQRQNPGSSEGKGLSEAWRRGDGITGGIKEVGKKFGKDWDESSGFGAIRSVAKNVQAMGSGVLEQTPNMMPPMAGMLAGGAAGSTIPVVGTIAGGWAGATLGNTAVEGGGMTQEALQKANINPQDKVATEAWLKANGDNTLKQAATKGAIIGAMDTLTMGMGHGLLSAPAKSAANRAMVELGINAADKVAVKEASKAIAEKMAVDPIYAASKTGAGNIARNVGAAALEPTGEFAGEYLGQGVATGEWDTKNAFLEAASSVGQGAATFVGQKVYAGMKDVKSTFGAGDEITKPTETPAGDPTAPTTTPSTIDFVPPAPQKKPEWTTELGASAPRINDGIDMPREFDTGGLSIAEGAQPIKASEAMGIDPAAGPLSKAAATAVDTGAHIGTLAQSAQVDATNTIANEAINAPATPDIVNQNNAVAPTFGSAYAQRQASAPAIQSTDILNAEGKPFLTGFSAKKAANDAGDGYRPFKVGEKQFVVRYFEPENATKTIATQASSTPATTEKSSVLDQTTTALQQPKETNGTQTTEAVQAAQERPQAPIAEPLNVPPRTSDAGGADSAVTVPAGNRNLADSGWKMLPQRGKADIPTSPAAVPGAPEAAPKADLAGKKIDKEWTAFTPESGTLNVPRAEMPQIKAEHRGAMVNFLKGRGIESTTEEVTADSLKPTQTEFSTAKVNKAKAFDGSDRSILVSSDNHVLDGHHQWLAKREKGEPVKVIKLNAPIKDLLETVKEFPSAGQSNATQNIATEASNTTASGVIDVKKKADPAVVKPIPAGLAKMQAAKAKKESEKSELDNLFGIPQKRAKAIERIAKGTAYFSTTTKAKEFVELNGLKATHEVVKHASVANRWDIVAKAEQPASTTTGATESNNTPEANEPKAQATPDQAPKGGVYTLTDAISADGPVSETVRLIVRPDGSSAIQRENGDVIDVTNMIRAGFSAERAIAQSLGDDTSGKNVSRNEQNPPKKPEPKAEAAPVEAPTAVADNENSTREASSIATSGYDTEKKIRFATFAESLAGQDAKTIQAALAKSEFGQSLAVNELEQVSKAIAANAPVVADQARKNAAPQKESTPEQKLKNQLVFAQERVKIAEKAVSDAVDTDKFGFPAADGPKKQAAIKRHEAAKKTLVDLESQLGALNTNVQNNTPAAIARQIQVKIAANRRAARVKSREEYTAKGWTSPSTQESEQADYEKEISSAPLAGNIEIANAILEKDVPALVNRFVNGSFEASEDVFHKVTGIKIKGLSAANKKAALYKWAGWAPEKIADFEKSIADGKAARAEKFKADELKSAVKWAWSALERLNIKTESGSSINGQEFIQQQVAKGFDEVGTQKKGVAVLYGLVNGTRFTTIKHKLFTEFLKAARDFGGLKQALESVNPPAKESDTVAKDFALQAAPIANVIQAAKDSGKLIIANAGSKIEPKSPVAGVSIADAAIKDVAKTDNGQGDWKVIGKNTDGKTIVEDKRGVRSYVEKGIRISETVGIKLTLDGPQISVEHKGEFLAGDEISSGQNDELDSEMRGYEEKAQAEKDGTLSALNEKEKAAKAKMLNALGKLATLASKNTRMNWTPEEEQKLLPIVIELFDGAMELGAVTFQKAVKYVRDYIAQGIDQETADAIPFDTLQGAYIATSGRHKDKGVTPKKEVASFESLAELEAEAKPSLTDTFYDAIKSGNMPKDNPALRKMVETFDGKPADNARLKEAQEELEAAIARTTRDVIAKNLSQRDTFDALLKLYNSQPLLNIRTSTSIANQAYSTPAPLAYLASELAGITKDDTVLEPTGGTGMLIAGANPSKTLANELNDHRAELLRAQGFTVTQDDAANGFKGTFDKVNTNPPFGSIKDDKGNVIKVPVDGYRLGQIDHLIAARALAAMKDDGKATLILGANKVAGGVSNDDLIFFNWLYGHYNVTGHFEVEGDLYARQGAGWPVRVISINGRQKSNKTSPIAGAIKRADNWSQVYEYFNDSLATSRTESNPNATPSTGSASASETTTKPVPANTGKPPASANQRRPAGSAGDNGNVAGTTTRTVPDSAESAGNPMGASADTKRLNAAASESDRLDAGGDTMGRRADKPANTTGATALSSGENQFQTKYVPRSSRKDEGVLIPVNMKDPTQDALSKLEDAVGNIDDYAVKELGYANTEELHDALMGLQVDSVASAIYQIRQGNGIVIADQTGIGKGRQAAAIIRWAEKQGHIPIFVTVKPSLFTDMYGDLADIGTNDINPFIMNGSEWISGANGEKLFANKPLTHKNKLNTIAATGELPTGSNALFMTYSQINVDNVQRKALTALTDKAVFILDESHNAGGASATGEFITSVLGAAKGVTYLSATYAKRPDNMPLYFKTDIGKASADNEGLMNAMAAGGLPLQTVVSNNLVKAGQMFRRERSFDGIVFETKIDSKNKAVHEALSDKVTAALRSIVAADAMFHEVYVKELSKQLAKEGSRAIDNAGNQAQDSVQHTEFSSVVHNFVRQMLLGLKAQSAADDAIAALKRGEKPIIAVENTMGSFLNEYAAANSVIQGGSLGSFDYRTVLSRALARTRVMTEQKANGEKVKKTIPLSSLDGMTQAAYAQAQDVIDGLDLDIPVSPIDWMRYQIQKAGYSVSEITGRALSVDYSTPLKPTLSAISAQEQNDKVQTTRLFNSGKLDALILNVAGSTGISLHASEKFADKRQRHMIVAQPAQDINIFMQMLGRPHRTGQVIVPKYSLLGVDLPTEKRPTALLSKKMKSLNANTSSNTESATSVNTADMLNKYGDQIVGQYLHDNYHLAQALGIEAVTEDGDAVEDIARKATGRLALQPISVQNDFYSEVEGQYNALLDYLNKTNQNDLEPRTFDFDAKELRQEILFEGADKNSPFGEDAIYGEYSIKAQGLPMKPDEINAEIQENLGGKTSEVHILELSGALSKQFENFYKTLPEGVQQETARKVLAEGTRFLQDHRIGKTFRVDINGDTFNAVVTNIRSTHKNTGNPLSLSKVQVSIAVNGALRHISVPATQFQKIEVSTIGQGYTIEQLFKEQPTDQRETAKIVTGNLLAAYGEIDGARGTIISFTKTDGTTEQGILLPKTFDFTKNTKGDYRLPTGAMALKFLQESDNNDIGRFGIMSRDGVVRVLPNGKGIAVQVPKSKLKGGKYFLDKGLIGVLGDFVTAGSYMKAKTDKPSDAISALDLLMKKQALYALPSMAEEAKTITDKPAFSRAQTETPAFKAWFGDSKVVDAAGNPLVVYHGTQHSFDTFDGGAFFTDDYMNADGYASGENVVEAFIRIERPLVINARGRKWDQLSSKYGNSTRQIIGALDLNKYDGVVFENIKDSWIDDAEMQTAGTVYFVANPNQIKSATGNNGAFDATNPDIRYSQGKKSGVLSKDGKFKGWPKFNEWTRAEYNDVVNLLPKEYRDDSHRREPIAAEDWDVLAATVIPKLQEINQGKASFSLDKIGNILVNAQDVDISTILGKAKDIADQHDIGIYVTGNLKHHIAQLQQAGFESELGLAAVLQRAANTVYAPMPKPNIVRDGVGAIMSYKPRGFSQVLFTRFQQEQKVSGLPASKVQSIVDTLKSKWAAAPDIVVASTMNDAAIPQSVRDYNDTQLSQGATGAPEGFFYGGKVYLIADQLPTAKDVHRVLFHETLGHVGLRGAFGESLTPILKQISVMRKAEVTAKAKEYGLDMAVESQRLQAAEEVLAVMAQTKPELGFVKRAIAAIRNWLRTHGIVNFGVSDNDIIANYILPARRFVEAGTKTKINETGLLNSLKAGNWYSELSRQVMASKTNAMPAGMWAGWIGSLTKKGVKPDEIEWSGVQDWLKMQTGKVTKDDVLSYLDQNGVQVEETVLSNAFDKAEDGDAFYEQNEEGQWQVYGYDANDNDIFDTESEAAEAVADYNKNKPVGEAKYSQYTLPGGTNYREVLLTLPVAEKDNTLPADIRVVENDSTASNAKKYLVVDMVGNRLGSGDTVQEAKDRYFQYHQTNKGAYKSSHWDTSNVLAHIRLNDRTDADGKRVLFVEEIQSDWGQDGKKKGFKAEIEKKFSDLLDKRAAARGAERDAIQEQIYVMGRDGIGVPAAPFVTATDKWLSLALKRVVKIAVDGGYDRVAFVNGEQSADRYDLSKQVDYVSMQKVGDKYSLSAFKDNAELVNKDVANESEVADFVGKEVAAKLFKEMADPRNGGTAEVSGDGLKVGGEGMKAFYDKIVPNTAKDVIRKLGGGAMEEATITLHKSGEKGSGDLRDTVSKQTSFTITEAMKEKASGGMPLFARENAQQTESAAFKKWFGNSKVVDANGKPLVVYHGTGSNFDTFKTQEFARQGSYFAEHSEYANLFAESGSETGSPNVMPVYLSIKKPAEMREGVSASLYSSLKNAGYGQHGDLLTYDPTEYWGLFDGDSSLREALESLGFDGVKLAEPPVDGKAYPSWMVFNPAQIKSATGNNGNFDASNPDIRFSRTDDLLSTYTPEQIKEKQAKEAEALKRESETVKAPQKKVTADQIDLFNPQGALFSRATTAGLKKTATDKLNEHFSAPGKLSWWHKSIGTMYNLAERSPEFKPVFDAAQGFINDVSYYATEAADMAPKILPKMENWRDLAKSPISATDNKAISAPIFEGTLTWARDEAGKPVKLTELEARYANLTTEEKGKMLLKKRIVTEDQLKKWMASPLDIYDGAVRNRFESAFLKAGVVWSDAELKSIFNQTPEQISLYKEFRAATDKSLDNMAKAEMLRFGGDDIVGLKDAVMDAKDADEAGMLLRDYLLGLAEVDTGRKDALMESANGMVERADKVNKLKAEGYAPLSRFGKYSIDVVVDGERQYFGLHETIHEANKMAAKMRAEFGAANVSQGTLSEDQFKMFSGITPETLELFGNMLGFDSTGSEAQDKAFQTYLKLTKNNNSAMRRLIHRKGIMGFSEDAGRVLASFVYSNARNTSAALNMGNLGEAVNNIPKNQGELKDAAIGLAEYIKNPQEEAQAIRGLLFAQYLGGSIASAFVNLTQPFAVSFPWLSQFGGAAQSGSQLVKAMKDMANKSTVYEPDLVKALKHAEESGIVSPQEIHQLMAQARGAGTLRPGDGTKVGDAYAKAANTMSKLSLGWGKVFGMAEQLNRRSTFIAAYRIAKAQNMANPAAFAEKAVDETQFVYSKASKMRFGRGAVGGTLMTFKTYSIAYLELLHRMYTQGGPEGKKAVLLAMGVMMLMSGAGGLPFEDDILDLVDGALQKLGYNINSKKAKQQYLEDLFGQAGADFVERGISGLPGMPLDVSGRLGMGNLIPGTGLFKQKTDHTRDLTEMVGPIGDLAKRGVASAGKLFSGDVKGAALEIAPTAVRNLQKGADMAMYDQYRDAKGYKVIETTPLEAALKAVGFQPATVARVQESAGITQQTKDFYNQRTADIRAKWAKGIAEKDPEQVKSAREEMASWNEKNPDQKMSANLPAIWKKVREMQKSKEQRLIDTAPKAMRMQLKRDLASA